MDNLKFTQDFNLSAPIIMAPMFLVSNLLMMQEAMNSGIMGVFPSLNFRNNQELEKVLDALNLYKQKVNKGNYGVNLIVQKTNILFKEHLKICVEKKVPFYITSLGNPRSVIEAAHSYGAKVYCDVVNLTHAKKCAQEGCDGFIAVGQGAGGHAGPHPLHLLIPSLIKEFPNIPIIAAGGIADAAGIKFMQKLGACGVSIGTRFIASTEAPVSDEYKNAIVNAKMDDIVLTDKISGTPCNIIYTDYAKKIGLQQNWIERYLNHHPRFKKYFKLFVQYRGMKSLEKAILPGSYKTLWSAGKSVELIKNILPIKDIVQELTLENN